MSNHQNLEKNAYHKLVDHYKKAQTLVAVQSNLEWDQETCMPAKGISSRAEMISVVSGTVHSLITDPQLGNWIKEAESLDLTELQRANLREIKRAYLRETKLPSELVTEMSRTVSVAHEHWIHARKEANFEKFAPWLEKVVHLKRKVCEYIGKSPSNYNVLLDYFEPGLSVESIDPLFQNLKTELIPLIQKIKSSKRQPNKELLFQKFPIEKQKLFGLSIVENMGFDLQAGRMDISAHPFCSGFSPQDVRLTTRYEENDFKQALYGMMHEAGHGLYEQGLSTEHQWTPIGMSAWMAVHESQSRFWENMIGRSKSFWQHYFPKVQKVFPETLSHTSLDELYFAINEVKPSWIRVEADEVNYSLHIILRYEIERGLIEGKFSVSELPKVWNEKFHEYFGVTPPNDALGVLQDVHWSLGLFGYFPTYTLGNIYAAQIFSKFKNTFPDNQERIAAGELKFIKKWLNETIHQRGMQYLPDDLIEKATGEKPNAKYFIGYLKEKFDSLYS